MKLHDNGHKKQSPINSQRKARRRLQALQYMTEAMAKIYQDFLDAEMWFKRTCLSLRMVDLSVTSFLDPGCDSLAKTRVAYSALEVEDTVEKMKTGLVRAQQDIRDLEEIALDMLNADINIGGPMREIADGEVLIGVMSSKLRRLYRVYKNAAHRFRHYSEKITLGRRYSVNVYQEMKSRVDRLWELLMLSIMAEFPGYGMISTKVGPHIVIDFRKGHKVIVRAHCPSNPPRPTVVIVSVLKHG